MLPGLKPFVLFADVSKTAGATATGMIDRKGYNFCSITLREATADVVSNKPTVLKISESDITDATGFSDILKFTGGTATSTSVGFVIAAANTSVTTLTQFDIDCRGRKRYLKLTVSPLTTQIDGAWGVLSRPEQMPAVEATNVKQIVAG